MARIVKITETGPKRILVGWQIKKICMCGLSKTRPYCDESHKQTKTEEENKTYCYNKDGTRTEVNEKEL